MLSEQKGLLTLGGVGVRLGYDLDGSPYKDQPTLTLDWLLKRTCQLEPRAAYPFDRRKE
jgi:hypothetical protein